MITHTIFIYFFVHLQIKQANMKENEKMELNLKDMENVCGGGVITGFFNPYSFPGGNPKKGKTGNERKDN